MKQRLERINELIQKVVGQHLQRLFPQGLITVTKVDVSADLRYADISVSQLQHATAKLTNVIEAITEQQKELQTVLGQSMKTKFTPKLRFHLDRGNEKANRVEELLRDIRKGSSPGV